MEELILGDNSCAHWGNLSESVVPDLEKQISSEILPGGGEVKSANNFKVKNLNAYRENLLIVMQLL